jgi:hypothetical protein
LLIESADPAGSRSEDAMRANAECAPPPPSTTEPTGRCVIRHVGKGLAELIGPSPNPAHVRIQVSRHGARESSGRASAVQRTDAAMAAPKAEKLDERQVAKAFAGSRRVQNKWRLVSASKWACGKSGATAYPSRASTQTTLHRVNAQFFEYGRRRLYPVLIGPRAVSSDIAGVCLVIRSRQCSRRR